MNSIKDKIVYKIKTATIAEQIIYATIVVFVITLLFRVFSTFMEWNDNLFVNWFALPAGFEQFLTKPWTIVTYGFLHADFLHILFNLILLYYIGNLFLDFFSKRDFLIYYLSGIVVGGIIYLTSYNFFPALKGSNSVLLGASAGVTAILVGLATKIPNYAIHLRFIGAIKLWYIAVGMILIDVIQLPISNTGGHLAHLGGALIGFLLTNQTNQGKSFSNLFGFIFKSKKEKPLKTVYKNPNPQKKTKASSTQQQKIDAILDKISKSGYEALTQEEKDFLFKIGKN
ncbi:rhomboid family intramembrane serine protease [Aureibaculum sp. 2210JD6-5]|uniref:rhomboid family intramembrane serine protease n=1 Tax=Aureibaculum sp. 2210JD6-5 TaxID=3103957 RepID=UPI002AACA27B|nr:rhomboid family intramembrane serine protease [Aureibaculum sp. 2210JD6-5]MDY7395189.1 rhomboid family intramembrane serine protease [Aureibaculum sp. 2210JD6-5]